MLAFTYYECCSRAVVKHFGWAFTNMHLSWTVKSLVFGVERVSHGRTFCGGALNLTYDIRIYIDFGTHTFRFTWIMLERTRIDDSTRAAPTSTQKKHMNAKCKKWKTKERGGKSVQNPEWEIYKFIPMLIACHNYFCLLSLIRFTFIWMPRASKMTTTVAATGESSECANGKRKRKQETENVLALARTRKEINANLKVEILNTFINVCLERSAQI